MPQASVAWRTAAAAALFLAALAFLLVRIGRPPAIYDEGLILVGADRVFHGGVPFRDFWNTHPPGQIWVTAGLFRLFGETMISLRFYDAMVKACLALSLYGWAARMGHRWSALLAFAVALPWLELFGYLGFGYTGFPALLLGLESLALLVRGLSVPPPKHARFLTVGAGLTAGLGALFRIDFGVYTAAAAATTLVLTHAITRGPRLSERLGGAARGLVLFAAGAILPPLAAMAMLVAQGATVSRLFEALVVYPLAVFPDVRSLPLPAMSWRTFAYYVPVWVGVLGLARGVALLRQGDERRAAAPAWVGLSLLMLASMPQARTRADLIHQAPVLLPSVALAAVWWHELWRRGATGRLAAVLLVPVLSLAYLAVPGPSLFRPLLASAAHLPPYPSTAVREHGLSRAEGIALEPDQAAAVRAVQARSKPGDFIFVGNGRHDRSVLNDALFYFLADRPCPTYYHNLLPGLTTRDTVQREIISDLQTHGTRCVVLCSAFDLVVEPNASSRTGSTELDQYIQQAYVLSTTIGRYQIWTRR